MKQFTLFALALLTLFSCRFTTGSGHIVSEKRSIGSFSKISSSQGIAVEVKIGPAEQITVEADDNLIKHLETNVSGGELNIRMDKDINNISNSHLKVSVSTPNLSSIEASSGSNVKILDLIKNDNKIDFSVSSAATINAQVECPNISANSSSGGSIILSGKTRNYKATVSSGSSIKSGDLLSENTTANASSGGKVIVHASIKLDADASSGGSIDYTGGAAVNKSESSGGSVNRM